MSFAPATAVQLKARFPKFKSVTDVSINTALSEALGRVSQSWIDESDYQLGQMLYAAHTLTLDGHGGGAEAEIAAKGLSTFDQIQSGGLSVSRRTATDGATKNTLSMTIYGQRYLELARRNVAGPRVAS